MSHKECSVITETLSSPAPPLPLSRPQLTTKNWFPNGR